MREQCINGHFAIGLYHYNVHRESLKPREGLTNGHSFSRNRLKHRTRHNSVALDKLTLVAMNNSCQDNYVPIRRDSSVHVIFKAIRWRSQPIQQTRRMPERYALDTNHPKTVPNNRNSRGMHNSMLRTLISPCN
ncbi:hypothetical protein ES288_A12G276900v1 [Gossypium darwinii]|uniref:Uncharacterized protein n=2 Tax=Gossypium TaxID=3633 RepID=A0A5D2N286_GOSTO|nr:hypothetical protein ES288_A12G276900v1 [Gossypium darwinii]TYH97986.1 hypothetical protein ES332_A12G278300v1 [Gossypium tomentosum]